MRTHSVKIYKHQFLCNALTTGYKLLKNMMK